MNRQQSHVGEVFSFQYSVFRKNRPPTTDHRSGLKTDLPAVLSAVARRAKAEVPTSERVGTKAGHCTLNTVFLLLALLALAPRAEAVSASGGCETNYYRENGTNWIAHVFTNSAASETLTVNTGGTVEYLVVAGGGGGGGNYFGGGGGAGGVRIGSTNLTAPTYTITVGAGGLGKNSTVPTDGTSGSASTISGADLTIVTTGGGRGASMNGNIAAQNGGSGGGGVYGMAAGSANGTSGELGSNGGADMGTGYFQSAGGGGARAPGQNSSFNPAAGGAGTNVTFRTGMTVEYGKGGGGLNWDARRDGVDATPNTGNGGEGGARKYDTTRPNDAYGGKGGSGIVIVRYEDTRAFDPTVTATVDTARWPFQAGVFTISRPVGGDVPLSETRTVSYTISGSATNGTDYAGQPATNNLSIVPLPTSVTIPGGQSSVTINLYPLYNQLSSPRTATITLLGSTGTPTTATITFPAWSVGTRVTASGGSVTNYPYAGSTNWNAHIFTNVVGSTNITIASGGQVEYLVVAGGGGGGGGAFAGAGGGAGGVRFGAMTLPAGIYTITVGDGGVGCPISSGQSVGGTNGYPSLISGSNGIVVVNTTGGGRGANTTSGAPYFPGLNGGSGGGGVWSSSSDRGLAVGGGELGNNGGQQQASGNRGGGGGGARTAGQDASAGNAGGGGTNLSFSGVSVEYAKGGEGAPSWAVYQGSTGADSTGNGGGGSANNNSTQTKNGGKGGSGIVIVRYLVPPPLGVSLTPTNNQTFVSGATISPAATLSNGVPPYSVNFYTNSASGTFGPATNLTGSGSSFSFSLGVLPELSTNGIYAVVTDSGNPVSSYTTATNTFYVAGSPNFPPAIQNLAPTAVATNGATFNGLLTTAGLPAPTVYVFYGPNTNAWAGTNTLSVPGGGWTNGALASTTIGGLTPDLTYYYAFAASNTMPANVVANPATNFITGLVTVDATGPTAQYGGGSGSFTLRRPATCTNEALTVYYTLSGSASNGVDYALSPGGTSQTFAAGATSMVVTLTAAFDADTTNEEAVLTLAAGYSYPTGASNSASVTILPTSLSAIGGDQRRYRENGTNFVAHIFTNTTGTAIFAVSSNRPVEYLVVAGGGGGGGGQFVGAGGGAGGVRFGRTNMTAGTAYMITVGAGGVGCPINGGAPYGGTNGYSSSISGADVTVNTTGGGRGGSINMVNGGNGGSGGGGLYSAGNADKGLAVGGGELGNSGGYFAGNSGSGGGGARTVGGNAPNGTTAGSGGGSTNLTFSGLPVEYARGGDGAPCAPSGWGNYFQGSDGAPNTGNGGGGSCNANSAQTKNGGNGGSGIVIVRYVDASASTPTVTVTAATARWPFEVGAFTITRPSDANTNSELAVSYTLTGTATNGVDYAAAPATNNLNIVGVSSNVTFGVGVTSIVVNLYPLYNPLTSGRTAILTLDAAGNPSATVTFPAWSAAGPAAGSAAGATTTNYFQNGTNYVAFIFTNTAAAGALTIATGGQAEYLVVAGGGGGGGNYEGGGGGAGGVRFGALTLPAGTYSIAVGTGGTGLNNPGTANNGNPSSIGGSNAIVVVGTTGGGAGGNSNPGPYAGSSGASGGGGAYVASYGAATQIAGELGNNGGAGQNSTGNGGGGGGAGSVGQSSPSTGGGGGTNLTISGVTVEYAVGGAGGIRANNLDGANAAANTGNGGGGGGGAIGKKGGNGGSGIVIVRCAMPTLTVVGGPFAFGNAITNRPSAVTNYTVRGIALTNNLTVQAPEGFQVSTDGVAFSQSVTVYTNAARDLTLSNVYVRFLPTSALAYNGNVTNSSSGLTTNIPALTGTGVVQGLSVSPSSLASFGNVITNRVPATQTYILVGSNLTDLVTVRVPSAMYWVSTNNTDFFNTSLPLTPSGDTNAPAGATLSNTVWVKFAPTSAGAYGGSITNSSPSASDKLVSVNGTGVVQGVSVSTNLLAFSNVILGRSVTNNYSVAGSNLSAGVVVGAPTGYQVSTNTATGFVDVLPLPPTSGDTNSPQGAALASTPIYVKFVPVSTTPYDSSVTNSSLSALDKLVSVTGTGVVVGISVSGGPFAFGNVITNKVSTNQSYTVSGSNLLDSVRVRTPSAAFQVSTNSGSDFGASVTLYPAGDTNAAGGAELAEQTVYVRFAPTTPGSFGGSITNTTFGMSDTTQTVSGTGVVQGLSVSPAALAFGLVPFGVDSNLTYTLAGSNLEAAVVVSAPAGFTVSTNGTAFADSVTVTPAGDLGAPEGVTLPDTTITVQFSPSAEGVAYSGSIANRTIGASVISPSVSGRTPAAGTVYYFR